MTDMKKLAGDLVSVGQLITEIIGADPEAAIMTARWMKQFASNIETPILEDLYEKDGWISADKQLPEPSVRVEVLCKDGSERRARVVDGCWYVGPKKITGVEFWR